MRRRDKPNQTVLDFLRHPGDGVTPAQAAAQVLNELTKNRRDLYGDVVRLAIRSAKRDVENPRKPSPLRRPSGHHRGSRTQAERPILYTREVELLGRPENHTASRRTKGKMESGPTGG
jgi:hypothetical protein